MPQLLLCTACRLWMVLVILAAAAMQNRAVAQPAHNATILSFKIEDQMTAGQTYTVNVEVRNTGFTGWRAKDGFALACHYGENASTAGEAFNFEEPLKRDLPVGGRVSFTHRVEAPRTPGNYELSVFMTAKGRRFGSALAETVTIAANPVALIDPTIPSKATANTEYALKIGVRNVGETNWHEDDYSLACTLPQYPSDATTEERARFAFTEELPGDWLYGKTDEITRRIVMPNTPGRYVLRLTLMGSGRPFVCKGNAVDVVVQVAGATKAEIKAVTIEKKMKVGRTYKVKVRVANAGDIALLKGEWGIECESKAPTGVRPARDDFRFTSLAKQSLQPDATYEITQDVEAPKGTGDWNLEFQLEIEGKAVGRPYPVKVNVAN